MKLNLQQAEALVRLRESPDFRAFLGAIGDYASVRNELLIMKDDINTELFRGELRAFAMIQKAVDGAPDMAKKLSQPIEE